MCNCIDKANRQLRHSGHTLAVANRSQPGSRSIERVPLLRAVSLDPLRRGRGPTVLATHCPFCGEKFGSAA
jgi:hypothetical protein